MQRPDFHGRRRRVAFALVGTTLVAAAAIVGTVKASDHQDTPEVELSPRYDVNDVYAFPGSAPGRIAFVLSTSSPLTPATTQTHGFGTDELYQIKIDNNNDAVEDLVFQITFSGPVGNQEVFVRGPVAPNETGTANTLVTSGHSVSGPVNTLIGSPDGVQVFAGPRDDPFFLDLEQFFRIVPDRKPVTGPLSQLPNTPTANSFRPAGQAVDYLAGYNDLAIVIELPSIFVAGQGGGRLGIWGTTSRPRPGTATTSRAH